MPTKKKKDERKRIRAEIEGSSVSRYRLAQETGIEESALSRFMSASGGCRWKALDRLFEYFDLEITPTRRKRSGATAGTCHKILNERRAMRVSGKRYNGRDGATKLSPSGTSKSKTTTENPSASPGH